MVSSPVGPGLHDPCEKEPTNTLSAMTDEEAEAITYNAQVQQCVSGCVWEEESSTTLSDAYLSCAVWITAMCNTLTHTRLISDPSLYETLDRKTSHK